MPHDVTASPAAINLARVPSFRLGVLDVRPATRQAIRGDTSETLEPRVMQLLVALAEARGEVVSRDELIARCWSGTIVGDNAIHRVVSRLRELAAGLGQGSFAVETITKVGYRLVPAAGTPASQAVPAPQETTPWIARHDDEHWGVFGLVTFWRLGTRRRGESGSTPRRSSDTRIKLRLAVVALLLLVATGAVLWLTVLRREAAAPEPVSLAVLPFRNLSAADAYFADGLAEEILSQLARQPGLRVAGRTSSWMFRDDADPRDIGRRLDVAWILEGSVRQAGRQVRVDVALVGTDDGMRSWSQSFRGNVDDIFAIQGRIGSSVVGNLVRRIGPPGPVLQARSTGGDVYNLYLTARGLMRSREPANVEAAAELLRRAVRIDPAYAPAWALLAHATAARTQVLGTSPERMRALFAEATGYAERAIRLGPDLPEARGAAAALATDISASLRHLEQAVRLAPGDAELWYALSEARAVALDFEGELEALRRTAAIDPFWVRATGYPLAAWMLGERQEALAFERRMISRHPDPLGRITARVRLAGYRLDWSEAYRLSRAADRMRPLQVRAREYFPEPIFLRLRLGLLDEAEPLMSFPIVLDMARGRAPSLADLLRQAGSPASFWAGGPVKRPALLRLNQQGRGADILTLYDAAYRSPEAMAARGAPLAFVADAAPVVVALRDAGRNAEAERLLSHADRALTGALRRGRVPFDTIETAARVRALQGRRDEALRLLERAVAMGWQWQFVATAPRLSDDPVYGSLRDDPRLRRLDAIIQNAIARERREVQDLVRRTGT